MASAHVRQLYLHAATLPYRLVLCTPTLWKPLLFFVFFFFYIFSWEYFHYLQLTDSMWQRTHLKFPNYFPILRHTESSQK